MNKGFFFLLYSENYRNKNLEHFENFDDKVGVNWGEGEKITAT